MINYRGLKRLLGETSLERKCRLLFGLALMILITTSFWIYARRTRQLVENQQVLRAKNLAPNLWGRWHLERVARRLADAGEDDFSPDDISAATDDDRSLWEVLESQFSRVEDFKAGADWGVILKGETPATDAGHDAMLAFENGDSHHYSFRDDTATDERRLRFYASMNASESCRSCHNDRFAAQLPPSGFVAMVFVDLSMKSVEDELSRNRIVLLASGILTTFIAMLVAYIIVRYIIVKPVQHLKDVSDEIARGNLNLRAEINTGDEFEELSQAFNRMLRHMTTVNDELRGVNDNLDAKVDQLAQANMELFRSNALKDEFLATMSHELRTPLNSILGFSDVLSNSDNLNDRQKRYVENIRTSGRNLMVQINDLLDIAKIESGQMKLQPTEVNLTELIDHQCAQILPLADQKNIELKFVRPAKPLPHLNQDGGKIRQILTNLLSNAVKFTPEGGRVRVTAQSVEDDQVEISVEDTGIGIPMQEQSEIFEKFRQGTTVAGQRDHVKREYGGTGLGLSIVRELSRLLGGDVELDSEFGKGSMFSVRIPVTAPPESPPTEVPLESPSEANRSITSVDLLNTEPDADGESDSDSETTSAATRDERDRPSGKDSDTAAESTSKHSTAS